jgi:hypothetical protein
MERVNALINKLQEQAAQHADAAELLGTVQQLQAELVRHITTPAPRAVSTGKVSVMMPAGGRVAVVPAHAAYVPAAAEEEEIAPVAKNGVEKNGTNGAGNNGAEKNGSERNGSDKNGHGKSHYQPQPAAKKEEPAAPGVQQPVAQPAITQPVAVPEWAYDPVREVPTLAQQQPAREINDIIGQSHTSLNDRLKNGQTELSDVLTDVPVKDLKKAIGINDRYVFVNELFRGDEAMYERSIKTINAFRILPEAEYWMERELKVKLAWDDGKTTTQHFYQLVKRRFS